MKKMTIPARRTAGYTGTVYAAALRCRSVTREEPLQNYEPQTALLTVFRLLSFSHFSYPLHLNSQIPDPRVKL
jgi:hypothetical protein